MALARWSQRHQKCKAGQSAKQFGSSLRTVPIHHLLAMAAMRQDDRSSIHIRLQGTLFPNFSSQLEGDRARQKVGNDFCVFESQSFFFSAHDANLPNPLPSILRTHRAHVLSEAMQKIRRSILKKSYAAPRTRRKPLRHPPVSRSSRKPCCPLSWPTWKAQKGERGPKAEGEIQERRPNK